MDRLSRFVQELKTFRVKDTWTHVRHQAQIARPPASTPLLVVCWIALLTALSNSSLHRYPPVERSCARSRPDMINLICRIRPFHCQDTATNSAAEIVTQGLRPQQIPPQRRSRPASHTLSSRSARTAWPVWPLCSSGGPGRRRTRPSAARAEAMNAASSDPASSASASSDATPSPTDESPLAIVNPANMSQPRFHCRRQRRRLPNRAQPAFVSMPSLAGLNAAMNTERMRPTWCCG